MRTSPYDPMFPAVRSWSAWFAMTRVPEIVGGSQLCKLCLWVSADKYWAIGDLDGNGLGVFGISATHQDGNWRFLPTPQNTAYNLGGNTGPAVRCNYSAVYDTATPVVNSRSDLIRGIRRLLFPFGQGVGTLPASGEFTFLGFDFAVEIQAVGRFVCCSTCCATAPAGDLELTITGCGGTPSPIVVTLPKVAANAYATGPEFLRTSAHWETADHAFLFGCDNALPQAFASVDGYVLSGPSIVPNTSIYGNMVANSWLQCELGSDFVAFFNNVEYICPDAVHRYVNIEVRQSGGGGLPSSNGYGFSFTDCFPGGHLVGTVTVNVFVDADEDGIHDAGESASGRTVTLTGPETRTGTTSAAGIASFVGMIAGNYTTTVSLNAGETCAANGGTLTVANGTNVAYSMPILLPLANLTVDVFIDRNANGTHDAGEDAPGRTVTITGPETRTATTSAAGIATFTALASGTYTVTVSLAASETCAASGGTVALVRGSNATYLMAIPPVNSTIAGSVRDSMGNTVGGVLVTCSDGQSVTTVVNQKYSFIVTTNTYTISAAGGTPASQTIAVPPSNLNVDFVV